MTEWNKSQYKGLRYRESDTDFIGVGRSKRPRRYFMMTYKWQGKTVSESLGWEGDYIRNEDEAYDVCRQLSKNRKDKTPPYTLKKLREANESRQKEVEEAEQEEELRNITFGKIFSEKYFPQVSHNRKSLRSVEREAELYHNWIAPVIGTRPIREVMPLHLEMIKKNMITAGRSARTVQYCLAITRQIFNYALRNNLFSGKNPAGRDGGVPRPKFDNRRTRFLSRQEAAELLAELAKRSADVHDQALFSLYTGARAGEVFNLQWGDVDLGQGVVMFRDTKSSKNRAAFLTTELKAMLAGRHPENATAVSLVFPGRDGKKLKQISASFPNAVEKLKFNESVTDRLMKVTFHTLRHTFASWLAIDGINPFHLKELLGHSDLKLTERYSHLSESALKEAALRIQQG